MSSDALEIDRRVDHLRTLGPVRIGKGPNHPTEPNAELVPYFRQLLTDFPFLAGIEDYTTFIARYGGLAIADFEHNIVLDIFGIAQVSTNILQYPASPIGPDGFFSFASGQFWPQGEGKMRDIITCVFLFDSTGSRRPGIHKQFLIPGPPPPAPIQFRRTEPRWCWPSFLVWLDWLVLNRGICDAVPAE